MKFLVPNYSCLQNGYATVYDNKMLTLKEAIFLSEYLRQEYRQTLIISDTARYSTVTVVT